MPVANKLQDLTNQQKRLAEVLTSKGIPATATEKYDSLVDKVTQLEELRGEERTLTNIVNALSEPKAVVQLKYPEPKNVFNQQVLSDWGFTLQNGKYVGSAALFDAKFYTYSFKSGTQYTISLKGNNVSSVIPSLIITINYTDGTSSSGVSLSSLSVKTVTNTSTEGKTISNISLEYISDDTVNIYYIQIEEGTTATEYEPYPAPKTLNAKLGSKNLFNKSLPITDIKVTATDTRKGYKISVNAGVYTVSGGSAQVFCKTLIGNTYGQSNALQGAVTLTLEIDGYILIYSVGADPITAVLNTLQLEVGATATVYTPYISDFSEVIVTVNNNINYTPTATGEVTGITNLYPTTTLVTDNAGVIFTKVLQSTQGNEFTEILPSTGKNGITKINQPIIDSSVDDNIKPENIKKDINILGVTGSYESAPAEVEYTYDAATYAVTIIF